MPVTLHGPNAPAPGQIGLVHAYGWFARTVSIFEGGSPVTHCVLALDDGYCIGAEPGGARIRNIAEIDDVVWSGFTFTTAQEDNLVSIGRSLSGTPYSYMGDLTIGLSLLLGDKRMPQWLQRGVRSEGHLQCAQLVDDVYTRAGIHLFNDGRIPGAVYPASYVPLFHRKGWLTT